MLPMKKWMLKRINVRFRDELLNSEIFYTLKEAQIMIDK